MRTDLNGAGEVVEGFLSFILCDLFLLDLPVTGTICHVFACVFES